MKVIGITGTNGSGKGAVVEILKKYLDCIHVSAREMIIELGKRDGIEIITRDDLRIYNEKRNQEGKSLVTDLKNLYDIEENKNKYIIFESVRRVGEIEELKEKFGGNFCLLSVDTPIEMRFERIQTRNTSTDNIDFETFKEQERLENTSEDKRQMNLYKCIALADVNLQNTGSFEDLENEIKQKVLTNELFAGML